MDLANSDLKPGAEVSDECTLLGFSTASTQPAGWAEFDPQNGAQFTVDPTPKPILGKFPW